MFSKCAANKDGLHRWCKDCAKVAKKNGTIKMLNQNVLKQCNIIMITMKKTKNIRLKKPTNGKTRTRKDIKQ
jgi:hypothetical protein